MLSLKSLTGLGLLFIGLPLSAALAQTPATPAPSPKFYDWASTPPMGWNSWDCYGAGVTEEQTLANADYIDKNLKSHGWTLVTIDIQWYEPLAHTDQYRKGAILVTDENGRLHPAPNRFPLTKDTGSFKPIADYLHAHGLKFGLHLLRGIPKQSVDKDNAPILGTSLHAADIADKVNVCRWNGDMYGVDMAKLGAQEYYDSVFTLMASWDLDFVKVDDLAGHYPEIAAIRKAIDKTGRPIVLSISPGGSTPARGAEIASLANQWRISGDFWDNWPALFAQFARMNDWTPYRAPGHWPDADMIPFGNVRAWGQTNAWTHFTQDEQRTLMSLWCIGRSPLILGANLPKNDAFTLSLLNNDDVIAVNQASTNNHQVFNLNNHVAWVADVPGSKDKYLALFNLSPAPPPGRGGRGRGRGPTTAPSAPVATIVPAAPNPAATQPAEVTVGLADLGLSGPCKVRDLWNQRDLAAVTDAISATIVSHGSVLYRITPG